jgi:hypothetical protein
MLAGPNTTVVLAASTLSVASTVAIDLPLPSIVAIPNVASLAGPPRQPTATVDIALVVSPPQFHTEASVDLPLHLTTTKAFVDLPLVRSAATTEGTPLATCLVDLPLRSTTVVNLPLRLTTTAPYQPTKVVAAGLFVRLILLSSIIMSGLQTPMSLAAKAAADAQAAALAAAAAAQAAAGTISTADFMKFLQAYRAPTKLATIDKPRAGGVNTTGAWTGSGIGQLGTELLLRNANLLPLHLN